MSLNRVRNIQPKWSQKAGGYWVASVDIETVAATANVSVNPQDGSSRDEDQADASSAESYAMFKIL